MTLFLQITSYNGKAAYEKEGPDQLYIYFFTSTVSHLLNAATDVIKRFLPCSVVHVIKLPSDIYKGQRVTIQMDLTLAYTQNQIVSRLSIGKCGPDIFYSFL